MLHAWTDHSLCDLSHLVQFPDNPSNYPTEPFKLRVVVSMAFSSKPLSAGQLHPHATTPHSNMSSTPHLVMVELTTCICTLLPLQTQYPRCVPYTGHVTIGGSICIEALTLSGGPGAWQPAYCVESIMQVTNGHTSYMARMQCVQ